MAQRVHTKRIYEPAAAVDGRRVLVDRVWPRGVTKQKAALDLWLKEVAPSTALRQWFGHRPERWDEFRARYAAELRDNPAFAELRRMAREGPVTLLYSARDEAHNNAVALVEKLRD